MAQPTTLKRPPIVEALVDLRASIPGDPTTFSALAKQLQDKFPTVEEGRQFEGKFEVKDGDVHSHVGPPVFAGVRVADKDKKIFAQFRPDGFTLNNVKGYVGGDQLIDEALTLWEWLVERTNPEKVSRVGLYYINQLDLPIKPGDTIDKYFLAAPRPPKGAPQAVSEFLLHTVSHDAQRDTTAIVIQQLKPPTHPGKPPTIKIAVEVIQIGDLPVDASALRNILGSLRELKNEVFFSLLTDKTVRHYQ